MSKLTEQQQKCIVVFCGATTLLDDFMLNAYTELEKVDIKGHLNKTPTCNIKLRRASLMPKLDMMTCFLSKTIPEVYFSAYWDKFEKATINLIQSIYDLPFGQTAILKKFIENAHDFIHDNKVDEENSIQVIDTQIYSEEDLNAEKKSLQSIFDSFNPSGQDIVFKILQNMVLVCHAIERSSKWLPDSKLAIKARELVHECKAFYTQVETLPIMNMPTYKKELVESKELLYEYYSMLYGMRTSKVDDMIAMLAVFKSGEVWI